jgi:hypothetical protein
MGVNQSRCDDVAAGVNDLGIESRQRSCHRGDVTVFDQYVALRDGAQRRVHGDEMAPAYDDAAFRHALPPCVSVIVVISTSALCLSSDHHSKKL